jgi:hypothetical protein
MRILQVTLGSGATQVVANQDAVIGGYNIYCSVLIFQNNASHNVRVGDNTVTASRGILLNPGGSNTLTVCPPHGTLLSQYYLYGTSGDVIDVMYEVSQ